MATKKAWIIGTDKIMDWYTSNVERTGCCLFSIWCGKDPMGSWVDNDDQEQAEEMLRLSLETAAQNGNSDLLTLRLHKGTDPDGYITAKTPVIQTIYVRACPVDQSSANAYREGAQSISEQIRELRKEIAELRQDPEGEDEPRGMMGAIGSWLNDPMVKQGIMGFITRALNPQPGQPVYQQPLAIAGPNDQVAPAGQATAAPEDPNQVLHDALAVLWEGNPQFPFDMRKLARMRQGNPAQYDMILQMLRNL